MLILTRLFDWWLGNAGPYFSDCRTSEDGVAAVEASSGGVPRNCFCVKSMKRRMGNITGGFVLGFVGLSEDTAMLRTPFLTGCTPTVGVSSGGRITMCQMVTTYQEESSLLQIRSVLIKYGIGGRK